MPQRVRSALAVPLAAVLAGALTVAVAAQQPQRRPAALQSSDVSAFAGSDDRAFLQAADRSRLLIVDKAQAAQLLARRRHALAAAARARAAATAAARARAAAAAARDAEVRAAEARAQAVAQARQAARPRAAVAEPAQQAATASSGGDYSSASSWAASPRATRLRECESSDDYRADTGNGYYGAYQFSEGTWQSVGGRGYPQQASPAEQDYRAYLLWQRSGWGAWGCA